MSEPNSHPAPEALFLTRRPEGPLAQYVEMFWLCRTAVRPDGRDRMLPTGSAGLFVNLLDDEIRVYDGVAIHPTHRLEGACFTGSHHGTFVIDTAEQAFVAGVEFRPGGAWPFVAASQDELSNQHVPLRDLWGVDAASLRERLLLAPDPEIALDRLERTLHEHLVRPLDRHRAVAFALNEIHRDPSGTRIAELAGRCALSGRRLARVFELQVGLTPKRYARLLRFRRALAEIHGCARPDWAQIALSAGYADQPHFVRDFKAFSGFTPAQYQANVDVSTRDDGEFSNHVPVG